MMENRQHLLYKKEKKAFCGPYPRDQYVLQGTVVASSFLNSLLKGLIF